MPSKERNLFHESLVAAAHKRLSIATHVAVLIHWCARGRSSVSTLRGEPHLRPLQILPDGPARQELSALFHGIAKIPDYGAVNGVR